MKPPFSNSSGVVWTVVSKLNCTQSKPNYLFGQSLAQMTMDDFSLVSEKPQLENLPTDERKKTPYR